MTRAELDPTVDLPASLKGKVLRFQALGKKVAVHQVEAEKRTDGGIVLPDIVQERPSVGVVQSVGAQAAERIGLKSGDVVSFYKYAGVEQVMPDKTILVLLADDDILGVLNEA